MKVYTLTGKSGTGKSYQALNLCKEKNIESIIDDGLFICNNVVEAGISAKRQATMVGAIKTALFTSDEHAESVRTKIKEVNPSSILIIGTSDKMTDKIVARLDLPPVSERIYIEDISTEDDREAAAKQREVLGKHVIPVPAPQLKRDFAGYFLDPMRIFKGLNIFGKAQYSEKTVVRPTFSYMGEFFISDRVITDIASCVGRECDGIAEVTKVYENTHPDNLLVEVDVLVDTGCRIFDAVTQFQQKFFDTVEQMTAFNVVRVDVTVKGIAADE